MTPCFLASEENNACGNNEDNGCLLDAITSSDQVLSVIKETGDHVLRLAFMNVSPLSSSSLAYQRYSYNCNCMQ